MRIDWHAAGTPAGMLVPPVPADTFPVEVRCAVGTV